MSKTLLICLLCVAFSSGCSILERRPVVAQTKAEKPPARGVQITELQPGGPAETAGLRVPDVITKYGEFEILDEAGFFAAKNHYEENHTSTVEIVFWRGATRMTARVPSGPFGIRGQEHDKTSQEFLKMMREINAMRELPQYLIDRGIYKFSASSESEILVKAKALVDQAERDGTLTPNQILVDRIYLVLDDAPPEDQKRLEQLLQQLIASQPKNYIEMVAADRFFKDNRYRAAVACFKEYLKTSSDDVGVRLNMGYAYNELGMYNEAMAAADYVFENKLRISDYGERVGQTVKATAALGLKDYRTSITYAQKAFSSNPTIYPVSLIQLAAAETGDLKLLDQTMTQFREASPENYLEARIQLDAVKGYALAKANQRAAAQRLVKRWKALDSAAEGKVIDHWRSVPHGAEVSRTFVELMRS